MDIKYLIKQFTKRVLRRSEAYENCIYRSIINPGDHCFDIGAHVGEVSLLMSRFAGKSGQVTAFEPVWPMYKELCNRVRHANANSAPILPLPFGVAGSEGIAQINVPDGVYGLGSMADANVWSGTHGSKTMLSFQVLLVSIDGFLRATNSALPDFVKIDVEGAELFVLQGAKMLLSERAHPIFLIEMFAPWERAFGYTPWEPISILLNSGYRFLFACPDGLMDHYPKKEKPFPPEFEAGYNVIAYIPGKHDHRVSRLSNLRIGKKSRLVHMPPPPQLNR